METYYGHVRTPADAIILFEACRIGLLPQLQRPLFKEERQSIGPVLSLFGMRGERECGGGLMGSHGVQVACREDS